MELAARTAELYQEIVVPAIMDGYAKDLAKNVAAGSSVLDCACGTGVVTRYAAMAAGPEGKVIGFDVTANMLKVAQSVPPPENAAPIEWKEGSVIPELPFPDDSFDVVTCQFGIMFMLPAENQQLAVKEMYRVCKPGGKVCISVFCSGPYDISYTKRLTEHVGAEQAWAPIWAFGDQEFMPPLFKGAGFTAVELTTVELPTKYASVKESIDVVIGWVPALQTMTQEQIGALIAGMETDLAEYIEGPGGKLVVNEKANVCVGTK